MIVAPFHFFWISLEDFAAKGFKMIPITTLRDICFTVPLHLYIHNYLKFHVEGENRLNVILYLPFAY